MPKPRARPGPPPQDLYEFSLDGEEAQVLYIRRKPTERVSPLSEYIQTEHQQGGLFSLPPFDSQDPSFDPQKKRRKKCGVCGPCLRQNCGTCTNCVNRKTGKQICKLRKCDQLKKRSDWEVGYCEDNSRGSSVNQDLSVETVLEVASVDGPRRGGHMEIGSHDRLQEGALSLEPANGVSRYPSDEEASVEMEQEQKRAGSVPPGQGLVPGHSKVSDTHQQLPCWSMSRGTTSGEPVHQADMEDACNLVAFSASVGSLPPTSSSPPQVQPNTGQLYRKFTQEMGSEGAEARLTEGAPEGGSQPPEDLNTLLTALSQAKHGHKPPNCNCDGPDCPDYLEWLEKKIKLAVSEDQDPCKMADAPPHSQPHPQQPNYQAPPSPYPQVNGSHHLSAPYPQQQQQQQQQGIRGPHPGPMPSSKAPIPCSPQVLSIAKEKNISLQTAIAIEALTQLSGTGPQAMVPLVQASSNSHPHQHHHYPQNLSSHPQHGTRLLPSSPSSLSSSSRSQSVPPGLHPSQQAPMSWEQHRPQSQGQPPHVSPLPSSASPFTGLGKPPGSSPRPQQDSGTGPDQRGQWMSMNSDSQSHYPPPLNSSSDPMSELKQLLGNSSGKFINAPYKLPVFHQQSFNENGSGQAQAHPGMARIKQEPDSSEYYHHTASMGCYGMVNGQHYPGPPLSPGQAAIRHSTQAALQQHLHYKRNLFSNLPPDFGPLGPRTPQTCQNLKKWWPQMGPEGLPPVAIKQEPKKKKSSQGSPAVKAMSGMLAGPPLPKPKQIVIKKPKQKASMPTFLPQTQITVQKPSALTLDRAPGLASLQPGFLPSLPLLSNSTQAAAAAGLPVPAQTQVSISNTSMTPSSTAPSLSENTPAVMGPQPQPVVSAAQGGPEGEGPQASSATSITAPQTSTSPSTTSLIPSLTNVDPKYEELIRQFEAEFGDSVPELSLNQPMERAPTAPQLAVGESQPSATAPDRPTSPTTAHSAPLAPTTPPISAPPTADQEMEVDKEEPGSQSDAVSNRVCEEGPTEERRQEALPVAPNQEAHPEQQHQQQQQQQRSVIEDPFSMPFSPLPKRMKIETSGGLAVLSTTCYSEEDTPTKDSLPCSPSLRGFLESPMRYLDTPTKNLLDTPKDLQAEFPICDCVEQIVEKDEGPYYNHLGSGPTVASIRQLMETRYGEKGDAVRIEKVVYTGKEGKSSRGCPIAKWVIRRGSETEKLLCLVRHRAGHRCANALIIILIMAWEGVPRAMADDLYHEISETLTKFGNPTSRRCGLNDDRTCACQGKDSETCGASFSFGCSWSMYFNGCKYARSKMPRKFRLQGERPEQEEKLRDNLQQLATEVAPLYKQLAPQAYSNQCKNESTAPDCRLGQKEGRPFSGITACMDFCAHAHKDQHNLYNGCTVVCTLTKEDNRLVGEIPEDEQLHVLPLYKVALTDEFGSEEGQRLKMQTGAIQVLQAFRREVRKLPEPAKSCRQRRLEAKKAASEKKKGKLQQQQAGETPEKTVIKTEVCLTGSPHPQGNKAIVKQEVKPNIKKEPFNGAMDGYPVQGADLYNNIYPHPAYYARGGLSPSGQPTAPSPVNGYHHNLPALPYGYYNYTPNALFRPGMRTYEGRKTSWSKAGSKAVQVDTKPDVQSLQARLAQSYPSYPEQQHLDLANQHSAYPQQLNYSQSRPSSVSSESSHRGTPVIKQEPMDMPVYEGSVQSHSGANTPSTTPQPIAWPGHRLNGSIVPNSWDGYLTPKPGPAVSPFTPDTQQFHQQPPQQPSPYPQQWNSLPGSNTPMVSPAPSPSPSPHPGNIYPGTPHPATPHPGTPRPSTPHASTPRPSTPHAGISRPSTPHTITPLPGTPQPGTPLPGTPSHWASPAPSPQPNPWAMGPADYSPGLKHSNPAGAYPDKMWCKVGESRGSAPLGLQEKAWRSFGGSAAGITPSPSPEGRLFPDALQQSNQACWDPSQAESDMESTRSRDDDEDEVWSDSEHNFLDPDIGGVAVAPTHGSILIECARRELHATTPLKKPDRSHPTRISLVFYQHKNLNQPMHGLALWEAKMKLLAERALQRQQEAALLGLSQEDIKALSKKRKWGATVAGASPGPGQAKDKREGPVTRLAPTFYTTSTVTVSPYAFTQLTGPYSHFV